jgi:hypothetical protein
MKYTPSQQRVEALSEAMAGQMRQVVQALGEKVRNGEQTLEGLEGEVVQVMQALGRAVLGAVCELYTPVYAAPTVACACGGEARYQRRRVGQTKSVLGEIAVHRPYYLCPTCHHGFCPLDEQLGLCAGGMSAGLQAVMALLGVQFPFEEAAAMLARLTLVQVSPNACRQATESLGALVAAEEAAERQAAWADKSPQLPAVQEPITGDFYVSMDGVTVHLEEKGWKNQWLGAVYTTSAQLAPQRPECVVVRTQQPSFYTALGDITTFGQHLWLEAQRRGLAQAKRCIVIGDGAHWLWQLAEEHFPDAIQILDWYHASTYVWKAAHAIYGEGTDFAKQWAKQQLDRLWQGQLPDLLRILESHATKPAVRETLTYFRNNQHRMRYDYFRTLGLQIGSGTIESGCKHVIGARLKQAGMIWSTEGATAVAKLRSRLKSRRWDETLALRPPSARSYHRKAA